MIDQVLCNDFSCWGCFHCSKRGVLLGGVLALLAKGICNRGLQEGGVLYTLLLVFPLVYQEIETTGVVGK